MKHPVYTFICSNKCSYSKFRSDKCAIYFINAFITRSKKLEFSNIIELFRVSFISCSNYLLMLGQSLLIIAMAASARSGLPPRFG